MGLGEIIFAADFFAEIIEKKKNAIVITMNEESFKPIYLSIKRGELRGDLNTPPDLMRSLSPEIKEETALPQSLSSCRYDSWLVSGRLACLVVYQKKVSKIWELVKIIHPTFRPV